MPLIAGVDSSTQSTKVVLCDLDTGAVIASGSAPHPPTTPPVSEQDPIAWWGALQIAFAAAIEQAGAASTDVRAISIAAQCHGLVVLDEHDRVIRPAKLWNDTTSAPEMQELRDRLPAAEWATRTGSVPTAAFTVSKVLWLQRHEPDHYRQVRRILLPHDWLTFKLTGRAVTDRSEASGTGYYNAAAGTYDDHILGHLDAEAAWAAMLPTVLGPSEPAGTVSAEAAALLGLRPDTVVGAGAGDQHASALGLGIRHGDRVLSLGTSGVIFTDSPTPVFDADGMVDGVADAAGGYLPLVSTLNAALVTDSFARILGVDHDELSALALAAPSADVPVLAAYLDGERKPNLPHATGTLTGIRGDLTREQIARAAIEGVVFGLRRGGQHLDRVGAPLTGRLILTGGAARSAAYRQLTADAFDAVVSTSASVESVAVGAAMQASACVSGVSVQQVRDAWAPPTTEAAEPLDPAGSAAAFQRYLVAAEWRGSDRTP
ncbi:xylulokinase [Curtobacterium flaccumfaciens]|uniref:xylulokinase n=1 Tax=Curtobacterium flaccumfaciens TaxID=2035 RepID=UPI001E47F17C|nr:xylulokinase [Curtobacterium allii]MCE0459488.1 xylulokinase [Curtobacterium allii]